MPLMQGLAVPFGEATPVAEIAADGTRKIYAEQFDRDSFAELPPRVPFLRSHIRSSPLGWAALESRERGLVATITPIDGSTVASDAVAEVASGVMVALSVGFVCSPDEDIVGRHRRGELPLIRRRGARLVELSLCDRGAYPSARITTPNLDRWNHEQSEQVMSGYRAEQERKRSGQRVADAELLARIDRQASVRWVGAALSATESDRAGRAVRITPARVADAFLVRTGGGVAVRVQRRTAVVETESDALAWIEDSRRIAESVAATHRIPIGETMARLGVEVP